MSVNGEHIYVGIMQQLIEVQYYWSCWQQNIRCVEKACYILLLSSYFNASNFNNDVLQLSYVWY